MRLRTASRRPVCAIFLGLLATAPAHATLGIFEQGNGIVSMAMGGVSYGYAEETTALGANPAHALQLAQKLDIGLDVFSPLVNARYEGNALGPDRRYRTDAKRYYAVPQGGFSRRLSDRAAWGMTLLNAGLGPDYPDSPYARFPGASSRTSLGLGTSSLATAFAYQLTEDNRVGFSLNTGYQVLDVKGLQFLTAPDGPGRVSESPDRVTNQGKDGSFTLGFSLGWRAQLTPQLVAGAGYRSKSWTQKHREYRGLLPDGGSLELPAIWGLGLAYSPTSAWTLAFDFQRYENEAQRALGNSIRQLGAGDLLGSGNGPGFGFENTNALKFGLAWRATPRLTLRAGYIHANQMVQPGETLFGFLGCTTLTTHYSGGVTWKQGRWDISGFFAHASEQDVQGEGSIPAAFGGGEADISGEVVMMGLSFGRAFGQ